MFGFLKRKRKQSEVVLYAVADGQLIAIEDVNDPVFAQKMMGDGYAVIPDNGTITAPAQGKVMSVFPTKHAIGIASNGLEILLHMGIDTVSLEGKPFENRVAEDEELTAESIVSTVDLEYLKEQDKDSAMVVVFTNGTDVIEKFEMIAPGPVSKGQQIGKVHLK